MKTSTLSLESLFKDLFFVALFSAIWVAGYAQNVGIGTTTPTEKFTVKASGKGISQEGPDGNVKVGFWTDNSAAYIQTHSNHPLNFSTNNGVTHMTLATNGNLGIGTVTPTYLLDVAGRIRLQNQADGNSAGIWLNNPANTSTIGFLGIADPATMGFFGNPAGWGLAMNTNTGNVGIKTLAPTNKLQIGSVGTTGFATNDLAIGNGTNAMAIFQTNAATLIGSTTDIILMPRNNGHGRVGINTNTPGYPLEVSDFVNSPSLCYAFFARNGPCEENIGGNISAMPVSIYASSRVLASEFNAYSDGRIKNIIGVSNSAMDLQAVNAIQITDYTMKDDLKYGTQKFKKVIAQEVEKVYPQVVSKHTDFIPNVYQASSSIEKTNDGCLISFRNVHNISKGAKKLRVLLSETEGMQVYDIVSIPSDKQVIIKATVPTVKAFVYGEEVTDFRTVDYEGLTTLNISATQELSKLLKKQQVALDEQNKKIAELTELINMLKGKNTIARQ